MPVAAACGLLGKAGHVSALAVLAAFAALTTPSAHAQSSQAAPVVYRCPGPPVLYTDTLTAQEARSKNCKPLTELPVAVAPPHLPRIQPRATPEAAPTAVAAAVPDARVRPDDQRSRDAEARRILEAELRREEARLNDALKASGTAKPGERVGADAAQIRRAESDIEAIRRELGRLR
jgi:plasmid stability protein